MSLSKLNTILEKVHAFVYGRKSLKACLFSNVRDIQYDVRLVQP